PDGQGGLRGIHEPDDYSAPRRSGTRHRSTGARSSARRADSRTGDSPRGHAQPVTYMSGRSQRLCGPSGVQWSADFGRVCSSMLISPLVGEHTQIGAVPGLWVNGASAATVAVPYPAPPHEMPYSETQE